MSKIVVCHCGEKLELESSFNEIQSIKEKGWEVYATFDGSLLKSCPTCADGIKHHAMKLYELTGNKHFSISHIIKRELERAGEEQD